jgi:hypothetical protein
MMVGMVILTYQQLFVLQEVAEAPEKLEKTEQRARGEMAVTELQVLYQEQQYFMPEEAEVLMLIPLDLVALEAEATVIM